MRLKQYVLGLICFSFILSHFVPWQKECIFRDEQLFSHLSASDAEKMTLIQKKASTHWLYTFIPRHRSLIPWWAFFHWSTWALFGNDDDGLFGEGHHALYWRSEAPPSCKKALLWFLRNPFHNLTFYVLGSAWTENSELVFLSVTDEKVDYFTYSPVAKTNFASSSTSLFIGLHGWKPFISMRICYSASARGDFFIGWRERGNFGIKCIPFTRSLGLREQFYQKE